MLPLQPRHAQQLFYNVWREPDPLHSPVPWSGPLRSAGRSCLAGQPGRGDCFAPLVLPHWRGYFCIILNSHLIQELIRQKHPHHSHRYNLLCNRILSRQHSHRPDHRDSLSYIP